MDLLWSLRVDADITNLFDELDKLNPVTKFLRRDNTYLLHVRSLFDHIMSDFPYTVHLLREDAITEHSNSFKKCFENSKEAEKMI